MFSFILLLSIRNRNYLAIQTNICKGIWVYNGTFGLEKNHFGPAGKDFSQKYT